MSNLSVVLTVLALYAALVVSPGSNFVLISRLALRGEDWAARGATLGMALAATFYGVLAIVGLSALLHQVGRLTRAVQVTGGSSSRRPVRVLALSCSLFLSVASPNTASAFETSLVVNEEVQRVKIIGETPEQALRLLRLQMDIASRRWTTRTIGLTRTGWTEEATGQLDDAGPCQADTYTLTADIDVFVPDFEGSLSCLQPLAQRIGWHEQEHAERNKAFARDYLATITALWSSKRPTVSCRGFLDIASSAYDVLHKKLEDSQNEFHRDIERSIRPESYLEACKTNRKASDFVRAFVIDGGTAWSANYFSSNSNEGIYACPESRVAHIHASIVSGQVDSAKITAYSPNGPGDWSLSQSTLRLQDRAIIQGRIPLKNKVEVPSPHQRHAGQINYAIDVVLDDGTKLSENRSEEFNYEWQVLPIVVSRGEVLRCPGE